MVLAGSKITPPLDGHRNGEITYVKILKDIEKEFEGSQFGIFVDLWLAPASSGWLCAWPLTSGVLASHVKGSPLG